MSSLHPTKK